LVTLVLRQPELARPVIFHWNYLPGGAFLAPQCGFVLAIDVGGCC
jgi:hypothetical protein